MELFFLMKKNVHIIYRLPDRKYLKFLKRVSLGLGYMGSIERIKWPRPIHAPYSITYNIIESLKHRFNIKLYDLYEKGICKVNEGDVVLGHIFPEIPVFEGSKYDKRQIANRTILKYYKTNICFPIMPYNHDVRQIGWTSSILRKSRKLIGICGDYWFDDWKNSPIYSDIDKFYNLNMAIDRNYYPHLKKKFNSKGKRKFLYIGRLVKEKNIKLLEVIAQKYPNFEGGYIGNGIIKGWKRIAKYAQLTPEFVSNLCDEYDYFISTSSFDAQATTILESMAWGLGVACTKETGYQHSSIVELNLNSVEYNLEKINYIQELSNEDIHESVRQNFKLLDSKYSWSTFGQKLNKILDEELYQAH